MRLLGCLLLSLLWIQPAQCEQPVPPLRGHVTDLTGTLTTTEQAALEGSLASFEQTKGSQLAVLIVPTTEPETIEQYGIRVGETWKLGRKKVDDGAILIVAKGDRAVRIEVGYGLEGALSDIVCKRIIEEQITPAFRRGDFFGGIRAGLDAMMKVAGGEPLPPPSARAAGSSGSALPGIFIGAFIVGAILSSVLGRLPAAGLTGVGTLLIGSVVAGFFAALIMAVFVFFLIAGGAGASRSLGRTGGFGGSSSWGGGGFSSGGGFSGGGGGFGGGGASGRW